MIDTVTGVEDGEKVLLSRLVGPVSTAELAVVLTDPERPEDTSLDVGLEAEGESGAETSIGLGDGPVLGVEGPDKIALDIGPLVDEDSVYGPPVDDGSTEDGLPIGVVPMLDRPEGVGLSVIELGPAEDESDGAGDDSMLDVTGLRVVRKLLLVVKVVPREVTKTDDSYGLLDTISEELTSPVEILVYALDSVDDEPIVQVSTLVVVRSVIWEVDEFVAIVVTMLVVMVTGRLGAGLAVVELPTDSNELAPEEEGDTELGFEDEGDAEVARVEVVSPNEDVSAGGTSDPVVSVALEELGGAKLDGANPDDGGTELGLLEDPTPVDSLVDGVTDVGTLDDTAPEDSVAEVEIPPELWQIMSASGTSEKASIPSDLRLDTDVSGDVDAGGYVLGKSAPCNCTYQ